MELEKVLHPTEMEEDMGEQAEMVELVEPGEQGEQVHHLAIIQHSTAKPCILNFLGRQLHPRKDTQEKQVAPNKVHHQKVILEKPAHQNMNNQVQVHLQEDIHKGVQAQNHPQFILHLQVVLIIPLQVQPVELQALQHIQ